MKSTSFGVDVLRHPWIIPIIPAAAFVIVLFFGTRMPKRGAEVGIGAMAISTVLSVWAAVEWITSDRVALETKHDWFHFGDVNVQASTISDGLTVMMLVVVGIISLLVQLYSSSYMVDDRRFTHFFAILTLFTGAMQWFVMSGNILQLIFGWEVMALCSFLLIGHWWEERHNVNAAMKAFLTTRAADIGLFVGMAILFFAAGQTFDVNKINDLVLSGAIGHGLLVAAAIALFIAVVGKSAQFPLHTWLPDAMAGPTPMSALIHAATMVVAGVFLLGRLFPVFAEAFNISIGEAQHSFFGNPIAVIGAITILIAAVLAFVQRDIKKVLSYSTVSQLGYMVMAMGVGAWTAAMFHLFTHAFFKALLFLTAGNISHGVHGFDLKEDMGGLRKHLPITHWTFLVGALSLVGVIPFAGFWSKEQITSTAGFNGYVLFQVVALIGTLLTAAYMTRCYYLAFWGEHRGTRHPDEAPALMTIPCIVLAVLAAIAGLLNAPMFHIDLFADWVTPQYLKGFEQDTFSISWPLIELGLAVLGIGAAMFAFARGIGPRTLADRSAFARGLYQFLANHYYLDWLYEKVFVQGIRRGLSWLVHWVDHNVVDNFVDFVGEFAVRTARFVNRRIDQRVVDGLVNDTGAATEGMSAVLGKVQNGRVQRYAAVMLSGVAIAAVILVTGR